MTVDYRRRVLTISRTLPEQRYDVQLPMRLHRLALVRGSVNGEHPVHFVVDTGGEVISVSRATADNLAMVPIRHIPLKVYGTSGWTPTRSCSPASISRSTASRCRTRRWSCSTSTRPASCWASRWEASSGIASCRGTR
jgi:hypothetical protein